MNCVNIKHPDFVKLQKQSGKKPAVLAAECGVFMDEHGRFPHLDEVKNADSEPFLEEELNIRHGGAKTENILNMTGAQDIPTAQVILNENFRDKEIKLTELSEDTIIDIKPRPKRGIPRDSTLHNNFMQSKALFSNIINNLRTVYGIQLNEMTSAELENSELKDIPGLSTAKAFVHNGQIYINTDLAEKDAPIHEMMHILMGQIRNSQPELYFDIVQKVAQSPIMESYMQENRSMSDLAEEAFVSEFARLVSNMPTQLKLDRNTKYELMYNAKRVLDSMLMGEVSVNSFNDQIVFNSSLSQLCSLVDSALDGKTNLGTLQYDGKHHILANIKQELMERNELDQVCDGSL